MIDDSPGLFSDQLDSSTLKQLDYKFTMDSEEIDNGSIETKEMSNTSQTKNYDSDKLRS